MIAPARGALGLVLATCAGCAGSGQRPGSLPPVAGCYALTLWPDEQGPAADARRAAWTVPAIIRLDTAVFTAWPSLTQRYGDSVHQASSWLEERWQEYPFIYWRPHPGDSIYVGHPGALSGITLVLDIRGQTYRGVITAHTDTPIVDRADRARSFAPVEARRIPCPGEV
jgi:hypothetical protein